MKVVWIKLICDNFNLYNSSSNSLSLDLIYLLACFSLIYGHSTKPVIRAKNIPNN